MNASVRLGTLVFATVAACWLAGCGQKVQTATKAQVSGKVTLDDKLLTTGTITFDAQNGEPPATMNILDGAYEGRAAVGKNKVIISATKKISMKEKMGFDGPGYDTPVEINAIPERYNDKSEITREVVADGTNTFNFDLKSK